jgi:hypothetical protein
MKISHYECDDWEAFYIDGKIYWQGHSIYASELLWKLQEDDLLHNPIDVFFSEYDFTSALEDIGRFPDDESEVETLLLV